MLLRLFIHNKAFLSELLRFLGEGQFGKVYSAVNLDTGELMAVKQVG